MTGDILPNLQRARRAVDHHLHFISTSDWEAAGREAYITAFHAAWVIMDLAGVRPSKTHAGMHGQFSAFARQDSEIGPELSALLGKAYDYKQTSDYGGGTPVTREQAEAAFAKATALLSIAEARAAAAGH